MSHRWSAWGTGAVLCWLVALFILTSPVDLPRDRAGDGFRCGRPVTVALSGGDGACAERAVGRVQGLAFWLLLTAPVTLGYFARKAAAGPELPA